MKNLLQRSVALIVLLATPVMAADIAVKAAPPAPVPPPAFSWTGCYLGGHVGGAWISKTFNGPFEATEHRSGGAPVIVPLSDSSVEDNGSGGFLGGIQAGCNYQYTTNWVVGIDGDASWTGASASAQQNQFTNVLVTTFGNFNGAISALVNPAGTLSAKTDFIGTLTGRFGFTRDRVLIYAKGGAAWAHDKYNFNGAVTSTNCATLMAGPPGVCILFAAPATVPFSFNASETRLGWTIGGGLEWAFWGNWSAKLEYDFLDFGTRNVTFAGTGFGVFLGGATIVGPQTIGVRERISEVKLGVNYLFNYGPY